MAHDASYTAPEATTPNMSFLRAANVSKSYAGPSGDVPVLTNISLQAQQGECLAIIGPSGSGKSTLLALMGTLDRPDQGEIWLDGVAVHELRGNAAADFRRRKIGFVFQMFYLLPNLTALENVMAPLTPYRREVAFDLRRRARELLDQMGLSKRLNHTPGRLSGGEQQRVAIARALLNNPPLLLADEPTGNLDQATGVEVLAVLRAQQSLGKQTLILVTHDPQVAASADRIFRLDHQGKEA